MAYQPRRNIQEMGISHSQPVTAASTKGSTSKPPSASNIMQPRETRGAISVSSSVQPGGTAVSAGLYQSSGVGTQPRSDHHLAEFDHAASSRKTVSSQSSSSSVNSIPMGIQTANSIRPPPAGFQFEADFQSTSKHTTNEILTQMTMLQSLCETYVI